MESLRREAALQIYEVIVLAYARRIEWPEQHIRRRSAGGRIADVGNAESTGQLLQESKPVEFRKDLLRHSKSLPLVNPASVADRDAGSILTSLLSLLVRATCVSVCEIQLACWR